MDHKKIQEKTQNITNKIENFGNKLEMKMMQFWIREILYAMPVFLISYFICLYFFNGQNFNISWKYASYIITAFFMFGRGLFWLYKKRNIK